MSGVSSDEGSTAAGKLSPVVRFLFGLAFVACGLTAVCAALDFGPLHARDINGPPWLGAVAGGAFIISGVFLWAGDATARYPWMGSLLALLVLAGLAAIASWIAFGAGPRQCTGGVSGLFFSVSREAGEMECRIAFGIGAFMVDGMLVWVLGSSLAKSGLPGPLPRWIEKLGQGMLLTALAPFILVLLVIVVGKALLEAFSVYRQTGKWPRNEAFIERKKREAEGSS